MILCANPSAQFYAHQTEIEDAVLAVMRGNTYVLGEQARALESEFAAYIGVPFAVGVANGTDALELAMRALCIGLGDEVITVSHTAVATIAAIEAVGAFPVLVDVDPDFYTLNAFQLEEVFSSKTKAVIAVHLYGQSADLELIGRFCKTKGIYLIEDVSQAHGAQWMGSRLGGIGDIACFSCYPTKNLGAIGDAGLITTRDEKLSDKIRSLREYGWVTRYVSDIPGRNSRLDELQAAILRVKLNYLDEDNKKRTKIATAYSNGIINNLISLPKQRENSKPVFHLYVVKCAVRNGLIEYLKQHNIHVGIHYPMPIHLQPAYIGRVRTAKNMKVTETIAEEVVSLPIYPELSSEDVQMVVSTINAYTA